MSRNNVLRSAARRVRGGLRNWLADTRGATAAIFGLSAVPLIVAAGFTADYTHISRVQANLQSSVDEAVLQGARKGGDTAQIYFSSNFTDGSGATTNFPADAPASDGTYTGSASVTVPTLFGGIMGRSSYVVSASATASVKTVTSTSTDEATSGGASTGDGTGTESSTDSSASAGGICVLLLDKSASPAFLANSGASVTAPNCRMDVKSTSGRAATFNPGISLNFSKICIESNSVTDNASYQGHYTLNCSTVADPFAGTIKVPTSTDCTVSAGNYDKGSVTLSPGTYCGWFSFNNGPTVTFQPGVYVIKNGGWNVNGGTWTGSGVTFYFADTSKIQFNSGVNATLSAPTSGDYNGILFAEAGNLSTSDFIFDDSQGHDLTGLIYLPSRNVTFNSGSTATTTDHITMVFNRLTLNDTTWNFETAPAPGGITTSGKVTTVANSTGGTTTTGSTTGSSSGTSTQVTTVALIH
ncbi:Putative Flp pilus-assembly TadE/G-like [Faunimonas pinastri]|uniref:Putative Flp pilus-assembly TadE/G-like n=1 Tax=Faunimonas pinastri TaxID=1855383 RepID=A0A1H9D162_9HYPH|nr:TadE/TadG family type IV pilus assembly protein [Faunimonas pinastri]SEQ06553.1 Putative Flp pilus-assembly TadE/G-like [Faunimonas pinastri]